MGTLLIKISSPYYFPIQLVSFFFFFNKANLISLHPLKHKTQELKQGPIGLFCSIVAHKFCSGWSKKRRQRAAPCSWLLPLTPEGSSTL